MFTFKFDHLDWLSKFYSEWFSAKVLVCDLGQNLTMTKTSYFFSIRQGNTCKSSLNSYLIILTDFHSFTVNEDKLQN